MKFIVAVVTILFSICSYAGKVFFPGKLEINIETAEQEVCLERIFNSNNGDLRAYFLRDELIIDGISDDSINKLIIDLENITGHEIRIRKVKIDSFHLGSQDDMT